MKIIVGLGNPGKKYLRAFHNIGFMTLEAVAQKLNIKIKKLRCKSLIAESNLNGNKFVLACPQTYMNLSGEAVVLLLEKFKSDLDELLVVYDDADIGLGSIRLRPWGSAGTHNGMKNIIQSLGSEQFKRLRIGIGPPPEHVPLHEYVLQDIPKDLRQTMFEAIMSASDSIIDWINGAPFDAIMQNYNKTN
ncbi:MAG TPA: aminoacyl-tRNA hydrolase [Clostridiales bacterium]|jgi:PTH1 family peptidyl-tRNA hydrolase|nr:aminoacyl-tRNA hydrolase [Clostridiales bacterium]